MNGHRARKLWLLSTLILGVVLSVGLGFWNKDDKPKAKEIESSYLPVHITEPFAATMAAMDGPIKTFVLRGIKESPPYLHDGRLLTLEDTVEFFNLVTGTQLTAQEKQDLVAFMRAL